MRFKRLIEKKTKKFIIKKLSNNFSTLFQSFNLSQRPYCDIPYVNIKFYKSSSLAKKGEVISLKIDGQILPKILETGTFDDFLYKFLKEKLKKNSLKMIYIWKINNFFNIFKNCITFLRI